MRTSTISPRLALGGNSTRAATSNLRPCRQLRSLLCRPRQTNGLIQVSGSAEIKVAPDEIHFNVGIETRHEDLDRAKQENDERIVRVVKFIRQTGVDEKDIQTDFVGVEPNYDQASSRTRPVIYVVQRGIGIKLRKIADFERLLTGLLKNGVTHTHGIDFRTSELRKHRDAARNLAIRAAREKADALAKELGVKRGRPYQISESYGGGWWSWGGGFRGARYGGRQQNVSQAAGGGGGGGDVVESGLSIGQISVSATVGVGFLIE